jgi:peptidoglycan/LPS O-acetylase OafA/YrhL
MAVVIHHALPTVLRGGFVGVDVFFVISGFLISGHISDDLDGGTFRFTSFYGRRARRIFPALAVVLLATLGYGAIILLPSQFSRLGADAVGGAGFISNLMLQNEAGYFDRAAIFKPLLHLWSLGVEEQYYIFWPFALWALHKTRLNRSGFVVTIAACSFALNVRLASTDLSADFYSPMTRLWELSAGALLALRPGNRAFISAGIRDTKVRDIMSLGGMSLILLSILLLNPYLRFPGWFALLPVVGAVMLIDAGPSALANRTILSSRGAVFIGSISYPLYLWHWPLISYAYTFHYGRGLKTFPALCIVAFSMLLAWATTRWVERPLRFGPNQHGKTILLFLMMLMIGGAGAWVWSMHGFPERYRNLSKLNGDELNAVSGDIFATTAHMHVRKIDGITVGEIGDTGSAIMLTGDSLLFQYDARVEELFDEGRLRHRVYFVAGPSCRPLPGVTYSGPFAICVNMARVQARIIKEDQVGTIVLGALWQAVFSNGDASPIPYANLENEVAQLRASGHDVYLIMPEPADPRLDPTRIIKHSLTGFSIDRRMLEDLPTAQLTSATAGIARHLTVIARRTGARTLDPFPDICGPGPVCSPFFDAGRPKFADSMHLRPVFVKDNIKFLDSLLTH